MNFILGHAGNQNITEAMVQPRIYDEARTSYNSNI